MNYDKIEISEI